jgi:hypothetical protein
MKRSTLLFTSAVVAMISLGGSVRADLIDWSYTWTNTPPVVTGGTGGVTLTTQPTSLLAEGNSDIVATNMSIFSSANPKTPDSLSGGNYTLQLAITDGTSNTTGTFTFTGQLSGTYSQQNSNITNTFTSPTVVSQVIGNNTYQVTIGPFSPPGPPTSTTLTGSIAAFVQVTAGNNGGGGGTTVQDVPEPTTMLLAGLGLSFLGGAAWRKRRQMMAK